MLPSAVTMPSRFRFLALSASFYLLCKPFAPLRLGGALVLTPDVKRFIEERPALGRLSKGISEFWDATVGRAGRAVGSSLEMFAAPFDSLSSDEDWASARVWLISLYPPLVQRKALKAEVLELASEARGGVDPLPPARQSRLDQLVTSELPRLNPTTEPARSPLFSGEWECRWTTESELNFAVDRGLLGLPWTRTYQSIDIAGGCLTNVIEFGVDGALAVGASIRPDDETADGSRFIFSFNECSVRWRGLQVQLPPVGRGWGELLYLDEEMRIQRDIRGDLLVATKAASVPPLPVRIQ